MFLPAALAGVYALSLARLPRLAIVATAIASAIFYALYSVRLVPLLLGSVVVNYMVGTAILRSKHRVMARRLLAIGIVFDLGLLFIFKYTRFILSTAAQISGADLSLPDIVLPVGISFYTFTQVAYLVDCVRGRAHLYGFWDYLLFVTFFPHLVAGPILKHVPLIAQLEHKRLGVPSARRAYIGVIFFGIGLAKKVLVADSLSPFVEPIFANVGKLSFAEAWLGALLYTFQLYYDFSGYSEMAVGLALMLNIRIPLNFNSPYKATSIIDFWRRWHMSLSFFLKNYLYIPLGGNRVSKPRHYFNLFTTMALGGIWHGAGWTFIIWGALHGLYLTINHAFRELGLRLPRPLAWPLTFIAVVIAWVFFRAKTAQDALVILSAMSGLQGFDFQFTVTTAASSACGAVAILIAWVVTMPNTQQLAIRKEPSLLLALLVAGLVLASIMRLSTPSEFLYFQF